MKFRCGDIGIIYSRNIASRITEMFPQDRQAGMEAERAFIDLGNADDDMVAFIYKTVVVAIDLFVSDAERDDDQSDLNSAEARRVQFKVAGPTNAENALRVAEIPQDDPTMRNLVAVHVPTRREGQYAIPTACLTVAGSSSISSIAWATSAREIE